MEKKPTLLWSRIPDNYHFQGEIPDGYNLAICPNPYIVLDVDRHNGIDGFHNIPIHITGELLHTYNYKTKNNGSHFWLLYTGGKKLLNKTSGKGFDLRTENGYVVYYPALTGENIQNYIGEIKETSLELNNFLEKYF